MHLLIQWLSSVNTVSFKKWRWDRFSLLEILWNQQLHLRKLFKIQRMCCSSWPSLGLLVWSDLSLPYFLSANLCLNWSIVDLPRHVNGAAKWFSYTQTHTMCVYILFYTLFHYGLSPWSSFEIDPIAMGWLRQVGKQLSIFLIDYRSLTTRVYAHSQTFWVGGKYWWLRMQKWHKTSSLSLPFRQGGKYCIKKGEHFFFLGEHSYVSGNLNPHPTITLLVVISSSLSLATE